MSRLEARMPNGHVDTAHLSSDSDLDVKRAKEFVKSMWPRKWSCEICLDGQLALLGIMTHCSACPPTDRLASLKELRRTFRHQDQEQAGRGWTGLSHRGVADVSIRQSQDDGCKGGRSKRNHSPGIRNT